MFEGADEQMGDVTEEIDIEPSVNPNGAHVQKLEKMADEAGVPTGVELPELKQSNDQHCTWQRELEVNDQKKGT